MLFVLLWGNISSDTQSVSERPVITRDNASQVELLHLIGGGKILDILWLPDGESLFVANQKTIRLFNSQDLAETPSQLNVFHCEWNPRSTANDYCDIDMKFADNATTLLIFEDSTGWRVGIDPYLTYWDIASQHEIGRDDYIGDFAYYDFLYERQMTRYDTIPEKLIINNNNLRLYDAEILGYITLQAHSHTIVDAVFNTNNTQIASVGNDGIVEIWDVDTRRLTRTSRVIARNLGMSLSSVAFSPDSTKLAVGGWDGSLWIFDVATGELLQQFIAEWHVNWSIAFNHDGSMLALGNDNNQVVVYDVMDDYPFLTNRRIFEGHKNIVYGVDFHPDDTQLASASADGNIHIWDIETGSIAHTLTGVPFFDVDFHPDGTQLACSTQRGYQIVPISSPTCDNRYGSSISFHRVAFSPDGQTFAYGYSTLLTPQGNFWREINIDLTISSHDRGVSHVAFSDDGLVFLASGTYSSSYIWHFDNLLNDLTLQGNLMALSPDGSLVAGGQLGIYDTDDGTKLYPIDDTNSYLFNPNSGQQLTDAVFSPNGKLIITAPIVGGLSIWGIPHSPN